MHCNALQRNAPRRKRAQVLDMPSGDLGAPAYRKFDVEAWMPGLGRYGEISSASNCTDYQARRLNIRCASERGGREGSASARACACVRDACPGGVRLFGLGLRRHLPSQCLLLAHNAQLQNTHHAGTAQQPRSSSSKSRRRQQAASQRAAAAARRAAAAAAARLHLCTRSTRRRARCRA